MKNNYVDINNKLEKKEWKIPRVVLLSINNTNSASKGGNDDGDYGEQS